MKLPIILPSFNQNICGTYLQRMELGETIFTNHRNRLYAELVKIWPDDASQNPTLAVSINQDGAVRKIGVLKSSGSRETDHALMEKVARTLPKIALPKRFEHMTFLVNKTLVTARPLPELSAAEQKASEKWLKRLSKDIQQKWQPPFNAFPYVAKSQLFIDTTTGELLAVQLTVPMCEEKANNALYHAIFQKPIIKDIPSVYQKRGIISVEITHEYKPVMPGLR